MRAVRLDPTAAAPAGLTVDVSLVRRRLRQCRVRVSNRRGNSRVNIGSSQSNAKRAVGTEVYAGLWNSDGAFQVPLARCSVADTLARPSPYAHDESKSNQEDRRGPDPHQ